ncbi:MAG TPA: hypothetical protein VGN34_00570, partial [Ktedonobacteraceae bacterium]
ENLVDDPRIGKRAKHLRNCGLTFPIRKILRYPGGEEHIITYDAKSEGGCGDNSEQFEIQEQEEDIMAKQEEVNSEEAKQLGNAARRTIEEFIPEVQYVPPTQHFWGALDKLAKAKREGKIKPGEPWPDPDEL